MDRKLSFEMETAILTLAQYAIGCAGWFESKLRREQTVLKCILLQEVTSGGHQVGIKYINKVLARN